MDVPGAFKWFVTLFAGWMIFGAPGGPTRRVGFGLLIAVVGVAASGYVIGHQSASADAERYVRGLDERACLASADETLQEISQRNERCLEAMLAFRIGAPGSFQNTWMLFAGLVMFVVGGMLVAANVERALQPAGSPKPQTDGRKESQPSDDGGSGNV